MQWNNGNPAADILKIDEDANLKQNDFMNQNKRKTIRYAAAVLASAVLATGCGSAITPSDQTAGTGSAPELAYETGTLIMGTGEESGMIHLAGAAVASVINNTVPGIHVALEPSKGAMINAANVSEGDLDLALISGDVAYDAVHGVYGFAGEPLENLRVLAACYQEVSGWAALETSGLSMVNELKGKIISTGPKASATELASNDVFRIMGIDAENSELYSDSIAASVKHVKAQTADASHSFGIIPNGNHESIASEFGISLLSYTDEELDMILSEEPRYFKTQIPSGTYSGQEAAVPTFGVKMLLCAAEDMDPDLAYEIARAMDLNGPTYTGGHAFMSAMLDERFLCNDLPISLHDGAKHYYQELGFLENE